MSGANKTEVDVDMDEAQVAEYLQSHPDFFERHQNLLTTIRIPHRTGGAVSLVERQASSLRFVRTAHRSTTPSEIVSAAPINQTGVPAPAQRTRSSPPGSSTATS